MMSSTASGLPNWVIRPSGIVLWNTSDSGVGGGDIAIAHTRGTSNSGYGGGVIGTSVAPAAAVDHIVSGIDVATVIAVVAASTDPNASSVAFAASAGANDKGSD